MTSLTIEQSNSLTEIVASAVVDKLYRLALTSTVNDETSSFVMNLSGQISPTAAYEDAVIFLRAKFPNLIINEPTGGFYFRFIDPEVERICINDFGDGIGLTAANARNVTNLLNKFRNNLDISSLEDLSCFTATLISVLNMFLFDESVLDVSLANDSVYQNKNYDNPYIIGGEDGIAINMPPNAVSGLTFGNGNGVVGTSNGKIKLKIKSINWGNSIPHNTNSTNKTYTFFIYCIFPTWDDSFVPNMTNLGGLRLFSGCVLDKAIFREGIVSINENFRGCPLSYIEYPSTITDAGDLFADFRRDAGNINNTGYVVIKAVNPPTLTGTINDSYNKWPSAVYVPKNSVAAYKSAAGLWLNSTLNSKITSMENMDVNVRALGTVTLEDIDRV